METPQMTMVPVPGSHIRTGKFIVLEGGEGAGKTTQIGHLLSFLRGLGIHVVSTREPGGTPIAEELRRLMVSGREDKISPFTEAMLMYAARNDHIEKVIAPALANGAWVVCDRFEMSTYAYQEAVGRRELQQLSSMVVDRQNVKPDLTLLLDIDPAIGLMRAYRREEDRSRFEDKAMEFHQKVRESFLKNVHEVEGCYTVYVGNRTEMQVWDIIQHHLEIEFGITTSQDQE